MHNSMYFKLAASNIKKNANTYVPYFIMSITTIMMFYIMVFLVYNPGLSGMRGERHLKTVLSLGCYITGAFSAVLLFYTNSFLFKKRKKEIGLYNILGMEKKHIAKMLTIENMYSYLVIIVLGLFFGILFSRLMLLILLKILKAGTGFVFNISIEGLYITLVFFTIVSALILLNNIRQVHLTKPVELLKGSSLGEKEPKTRWLLAVIGVLSTGAGYYIALSVENPLAALNIFFLAVFLVIIGTYCLFTAGSIALLKLLRKNKKYYYKTNHFTAISGMIYRMKRNAVGLANICILSAMVLVTVSSTVCLYVGMHDALNNRFPTDIEIITHNADKEQSVSISNAVNKIVSESGYEISKYSEFRYFSHSMLYEEEKDTFSICFDINKNSDSVYYVYFFPVEEYNKKTGTDILLEDKQVLIYNRNNVDIAGNLNIQNIEFIVKGNVKDPGFPLSVDSFNKVYLFFKDEQVIIDINKQFEEYFGDYNRLIHTIAFDVMGDKAEQLKLTDRIKVTFERFEENISINTISKAEEEYVFYAIYGGLFFLGLFLGVLFMMATVLIIYYKQISEGYEDKQRFHIMQQVGMTKAEVRQSIRSQVLTVFFLPLIMAIIHIVFAFRMITKILGVLYLTNVPLFINCTVITVAAFTLFYMAAYSLTAHSYYKIVE